MYTTYMEYREFITESLLAASDIARVNFGKLSGVVKEGDNNQVLTESDVAIGKLLVLKVREYYPEANIIDEEAGVVDNNSDYTWVIDPIDGTSNFASGLPMYGVMIGLLKNGTPVAGGVALPYFEEIYVAEKGKGAYLGERRIHVSHEQSLLSALVAYGIDGHQEDSHITRAEVRTLGDIVLGIRNLRSSNSAYDMMMVAKGSYGAMLNRTSKIWDNVAPQVIIQEAGGLYTDFFGKSIDYSDPLVKSSDNFTVCMGAPALHKQLQEIIHSS